MKWSTLVALPCLFVAAAVLLAVTGPRNERPSRSGAAGPCNGALELCAMRYDQVTFAATHNAMAARADGWQLPNQEAGIGAQLEGGIRALLLDTHYRPTAEGAEVALCHADCARGALSFVEALRTVRAFLDAAPREVVTIFIQDGVSARDTVSAFAEAGLVPYVHAQRPSQPWPTLGAMIASGRRLVVFAEHASPPPAWLHRAWSFVQDTRYDVASPQAFTCALNRGSATNSLFLLNHWVRRAEPSAEDAGEVNAARFLRERAHRCAAERQQRPNFIAVDFWESGDVVAVARELNGLAPDAVLAVGKDP